MSAKIRNQIMNTFSNYKILKDVRKKAEAARQDENRPHEVYSHLALQLQLFYGHLLKFYN